MQRQQENIQLLLQQALTYDEKGDAYNAVKLYKKIVRLAPAWSVPYHFLSRFYKKRLEWKPSLYYSEKAIEFDPKDETAWQILATSATALKRWAIARKAWNQLGHDYQVIDKALHLDLGLIPICIQPKQKPEIVWARQLDPARAQIESIPQPSSGRRYKEIILFDREPVAYRVVQKKRVPVYEELEKIHLSPFKTCIVRLETHSEKDVEILDKLCFEAGIGFDNWSKASRQFWQRNKHFFTEFYGTEIQPNEDFVSNYKLVALASRDIESVKKILLDWKVITLQSFSDLVIIDV